MIRKLLVSGGARRGLLPVLAAMAVAAAPFLAASDGTEDAGDMVFPSVVGEVHFPHDFHVEELEVECEACHHPVTGSVLDTPHPDYLSGCGVECTTCHGGVGRNVEEMNCESCHAAAFRVGHQRLSLKVAVHRTCSTCHEMGTGSVAGASCKTCHSGPPRPW